MALLWIYLIIIAGLVVLYLILMQHEKKLAMALTRHVDSLLFAFDRTVYDSTHQIFDYATTKSLLFHNQREFFAHGSNYNEILPLMIKDIAYLSDLTHSELLPASFSQSLEEVYTTWQKIHTFKKQTHIILTILTLGIAKLLLP